MKTAVSIPDDVYERTEQFARKTKRSRSRIFSDALGEYLQRHESDEIVDAMNAVVEKAGDGRDPFLAAAARRIFGRVEW